MKDTTIGSLVQLRFWQHIQNGTLTVMPDLGGESLGHPIHRVFTVTGVPPGGVRGDHAHKYCTQVLVSIPPGIWNHITFESADTVLMVLCDLPYDPDDYMRDRAEYLKYKGV